MLKIFRFLLIFLIFFIAVTTSSFAQNMFLNMIENLKLIGFFDILVFVLCFVVIYAILMKSKVIGENVALNGIVAIVVAFFVSFYSTFTGFSLIEPLSRFFTQASVIGLVFISAFIIASLFYPNLPKMLGEHFTSPTILYILIPLTLALLITSRTIWVLWAGYKPTPGAGAMLSTDVMVLIAGLLIFVVILLIGVAVGRGGK